MSSSSVSGQYPKSPLPAFPLNYRPASTPQKKEQSSIFRIQEVRSRKFSNLPPHAYQQNSSDMSSLQITPLQLPSPTPNATSASTNSLGPLPVAQEDPIEVTDEISKKMGYLPDCTNQSWSKKHIAMPNRLSGTPLFTACSQASPNRQVLAYRVLDSQSDLSCLTILGLIATVAKCHSDLDIEIFKHPIFNRSIAAFTPAERTLFVRILSLANFPLSQTLRNLFQHHFFYFTPGKDFWVNEETKINHVLEELKKISSDQTHFNQYKFDFDNQALIQRLPQTITTLKQRCQFMLSSLSEGNEIHLPAYFIEMEEGLTQNNFPNVTHPFEKNTIFDPTKHSTTIALPRFIEFVGCPNIPFCKINPNQNQIERTNICAIVVNLVNYKRIKQITLITSMLDPSGKIALMTSWESALLNTILKNSNYNLESKPIIQNLPNPPTAPTPIPPPLQQIPVVSDPPPPPPPPLPNVTLMVAQVATVTQNALTRKRNRSDLTNKLWQPNDLFKNKYTQIQGAFLKILRANRNRTIETGYFDAIENFSDIQPRQKCELEKLFKDEQYRVGDLYQVPVQAVMHILENIETIPTPNFSIRTQPLSLPAPVSSLSSTSSLAPSKQTPNSAKKVAITFLPPDKNSDLSDPELDRLFAIRKTANEKTLTREQQIEVFVHRQLGDTLIRPNSQKIIDRSRQKLPDGFFDNYPFLKPMELGEVGESFWATKAYSWFDINRFIQTAYEMPEEFRNATKEGLMNTYYRELKPSEAEINAARASISNVKNRQEIRLKAVLELFNRDIEDLEELLPPSYRHTWDDLEDPTLLGGVVGYHPEFEFNFKTVQTLLYHTILNVRRGTPHTQQFRDDTRSHPKFVELIALELLKNAKPGSDEQLLFRHGIVCTIPHRGIPWSQEQTVFVDFNTFDRANTVGLNARLMPNEPFFLFKLYNALDDLEKGVLEKCIQHQDQANLHNSEKVSIVYEFLREFASAIYKRYIFVNTPAIPERRSSPIKYLNMAIDKALKGCGADEIESDPLFETFIWKLQTQ